MLFYLTLKQHSLKKWIDPNPNPAPNPDPDPAFQGQESKKVAMGIKYTKLLIQKVDFLT